MTTQNAATKSLTIGKVAGRADVNIETIRYYERRGLMPEPSRTESGYRLYDEEGVVRLRFIKQAQELGFSLEEIGELLALRVDSQNSCYDVRRRAERKLAEITRRIRSLHEMQAALVDMIGACERGETEGVCPLLETIELQARQGITAD